MMCPGRFAGFNDAAQTREPNARIRKGVRYVKHRQRYTTNYVYIQRDDDELLSV